MAELTIAAAGVRALLDFASSRGANRRILSERSGIELCALADRNNRIPFVRYVSLMRAGQELCNDPALGLHFGESIDVSEISFAHQIGASSMVEAVTVMNRYAELTVEVDHAANGRYVLSNIGGQVWMLDTRKNPNDFPELTESSFARIICSMRNLVGDKQMVRAIHVTHAAPSYHEEYRRIFRVPVVFNSDMNALLLDESILGFRPPVTPGYVAEILTGRADQLLAALKSSKSTRSQIESLLMPRLQDGEVTMKAIASELAVSRQTLFRRLKSEGLTFEKVLDDLRRRMADHYLTGEKLSVSQTARMIGFSDAAAFSRAFKRWNGSSPRNHAANRA